ncbi:hypothetical protein BH09ACT10_BH09ACT10_10520 [soil metagenome]
MPSTVADMSKRVNKSSRLRRLLVLALVAAVGLAVKKSLEDTGGSYTPPDAPPEGSAAPEPAKAPRQRADVPTASSFA